MTARFRSAGRKVVSAILLGVGGLLVAGCAAQTETGPLIAPAACAEAGRWLDPATKQVLDAPAVFAGLAEKDVVLLGESHTERDHHLWQSQTIAGLKALRSNLVLGFEMFPRSVQPALDAWSAGEVSREEFLKQSRWSEVWGYNSELYMPMFEQARVNRSRMIALNVDRGLISQVGRDGWDAVAEQEREGLTDPAPASATYRESLARVFLAKTRHGAVTGAGGAASAAGANEGEPDMEKILSSERFENFVQAQIIWDRAMAEGLAAAAKADPSALVVGVMGRGHVEFGYGVPHQLADLGIENVAILIPVDAGEECNNIEPALADAVFTVDPARIESAERPKPRLGVLIEAVEAGVRVLRITENSVAEAANLIVGDIIVTAAGIPVRENRELVEVIQRQAPGTWLPLDVRRGDDVISIIAKFPSLLREAQ